MGADEEWQVRKATVVSVRGCSPGPVWLLSLASASSPAPRLPRRGPTFPSGGPTTSMHLPASWCDVSLAVPGRKTLLASRIQTFPLSCQPGSQHRAVCVSFSTPHIHVCFKDTLLQPWSQCRSVSVCPFPHLISMFVLKTCCLSNE